MVLSIVGCKADSTGGKAGKDGDIVIAVVPQQLGNPVFLMPRTGPRCRKGSGIR